MNKFDAKFEKIIQKYFRDEFSFNTVNPIHAVGEIIREKCTNKRFAIWGGGDHTNQLHRYFSVELKNALFIIDNNEELRGSKVLGYDVVLPDELHKYDLDVILISSYSSSKTIKKQIQDLGIKCEAVDFYETLEKKNIKLKAAFYSNPGAYLNLYNIKQEYIGAESDEEREKKLSNLIYLYLSIRDIHNAYRFIDEYADKGFSEVDKFKALKSDVEGLIDELKAGLENRTGTDLMLLFFDSLRAMDVFPKDTQMKYLQSILKDSICLKKAYAPSIFTYESIPSVFSGKRPFDDNLFKKKTIDQSESKVIQYALDKGFNVKIYSLGYWNIIEGKDIEYGQDSNCAPQTLWNALCDLAQNKNENTIYLLYFEQEIHPPHICGYHTIEPKSHITPFTCNNVMDQSQEDYSKQYNESLAYVDDQLKFYFGVMSPKTTKVIFSDHGQIIDKALSPLKEIGTFAGWHTIRYNVPVIVSGAKIKAVENDKMFSMMNFGYLLKGLIDNEVNIVNPEIAEVNFSQVNNEIIREKYKEDGYDDYIYGFRVFLTDKYKLVVTGNGKKKVYLLSDEFNEVTDKNEVSSVINYFKEKDCDFNIPV